MRLVQILIPKGNRSSVIGALDENGIDYAVFDEVGRGEFEAMVQFPIPPSGVEPVMEELVEAGVREDAYTIVLPTETVVSQRLSALVERFPGLRISRDELYARAQDLAPANSTFYAFLILSTVIATTGLLLDSSATIIGAMVVAPLMGPAISASVGAILDDPGMASRGITLQVTGLFAAIVTAALMGWLLQQTILIPPGLDIQTIPQIAERTSPNFLSLFLALGSGIAGSLSIMRGSGSTLVGVAIAVALVPPAATSGLGIAFGLTGVAIAGAVLVIVNLLAINVSALILFYAAGFRPLEAEKFEGVRESVVSRIVVIGIAIAVLSIALGTVTWATFQTQSFEQRTQDALEQRFEEANIEDVELVSVTVDYRPADLLLGNQPQVDVLVAVPRNADVPPDLAQRWDDELTAAMGRDVVVRVGFIEAQLSDGRSPASEMAVRTATREVRPQVSRPIHSGGADGRRTARPTGA
ncbi:TIGR00341 family protein [Haloarcula marina]|uniref:TIGR00341 family protein n=1 Tax=Haloarcula marina TaxID=2961574 RepID=UPI0020B900B0|nr:TIGR00341 family protein [Halomicroarcula marina]